MKKPTISRVLSFLLAIILLLGLTFSASSSTQQIKSSFPTDMIAISTLVSNQYSPDIAYNSLHNEYLVVWENLWAGGGHDIYAQRVSTDGHLLSWFSVSTSAYSKMNPSVAYDPTHDRYLVVFAYDYDGTGRDWDIYGRFIPWNGPDAALTDFVICDWNSHQRRPVTAFALSQDEFLVTWTNAPDGQPTYISARRVYADGSGFPANPFLVSSGPQNRDFQDVTYNLARNEYLVTWDVDQGSGNLDIYGIRLTATGSFLYGGNPFVLGEFPIAGWPDLEEHPSAAACYPFDQYLVAWHSDQGTGGADYAIYAYSLNGDAVPQTVALISDTTSPQLQVDLACNFQGNGYFIAWQDQYVSGEFGIWGRLAYPNGSLDPEFAVAAPRQAADRQYPAVAGGRSNYLAAWEHDQDFGVNVDIYGRLLGYFMYLPLVKR